MTVTLEGGDQGAHVAGRAGQTFGQGAPGNDTKEGGAVNEDKVKNDVRLPIHMQLPLYHHPHILFSASQQACTILPATTTCSAAGLCVTCLSN